MGVSMLQINLLGSAISGALVVLFGAGYALLFAFSQLKKARVCWPPLLLLTFAWS